MGLSNHGSQDITYNYHEEATAEDFNKVFNIFFLDKFLFEQISSHKISTSSSLKFSRSFISIFRYWSETDPELGREVYVKHAGTYIPDEILPKRKLK